jgi:broad specificity phosphatase PhoE
MISEKSCIRLYLVRHGNTFEEGQVPTQVGLRTDMPLTAKGREQAKQMGLFLKESGVTLARIYAGGLIRQREAAQIIAGQLGCENRVNMGEPALDEVDYGDWEGLTSGQIKARWPEECRNWEEAAQWPAGIFVGSFAERIERIKHWVEHVRLEHERGETVLAATSNGNIRFFCYFISSMWEELVEQRRMKELKVGTGNYCELQVLPESINILQWNKKP